MKHGMSSRGAHTSVRVAGTATPNGDGRAWPMHIEWVREVRDQCKKADVPFFFKQWGKWRPLIAGEPGVIEKAILMSRDGMNLRGLGAGSLTNELVLMKDWGDCWNIRPGKKKSGRYLDGREWNEFPV